jgi:CDP-glycerol glycerophosphotransferase
MFNKIRVKWNKWINQKKNKIKLFIYNRYYVPKLEVDKNLILFESMLGRNYSGNPKGIYEELLSRGLDQKYDIVWILNDTSMEIPGRVQKVARGSLKYLKLLAKSRMWVFDTRQANYVIKKKETEYIMTWHGTPLKRLALDMDEVQMAGNKGIENYKANFWNNSRRWDYLIAQNKYSEKIFKNCFDFHKKMLTIGYPRNDMLVNNNNKEYIDALKDKYGIPKDKKIVLYAPTWRDDQSIGKGKYIFNPHINFDYLKRELSDEYVFIIKYHYLIASKIDWTRFSGFIYDLNVDIQELYLIADMLMTDYSSVMFDYSVLKRPMLFYTYDLDQYYDSRGFYFDFKEEAPGPFIYNYEQLVDVLKVHDFSQYQEKLEAFHKKYNSLDDGKSSAKVVDIIEDKMGK